MNADLIKQQLTGPIEFGNTFDIATTLGKIQAKMQLMSIDTSTKKASTIEDELEKERITWFINQGKCPYCGTKLRRGKNDKNHIRRWWCIKDNIYLSKD